MADSADIDLPTELYVGTKRRRTDEEGHHEVTATVAVDDAQAKADGERIRKLLTFYTKESLTNIIVDLVMKYGTVYDDVFASVSNDVINRKVFVRRMPFELDKAGLKAEMEKFGEVEDIVILTDHATKKSKGHGFVTFKRYEDAARLLECPERMIMGRSVFFNLAADKKEPTAAAPAPSSGSSSSSVGGSMATPAVLPNLMGTLGLGLLSGGGMGGFGGGVDASTVAAVSAAAAAAAAGGAGGMGTIGPRDDRRLMIRSLIFSATKEELQAVFEAYGPVEECVILTDKETGKPRGFGFVTMRYTEGAQAALANPPREIKGRAPIVTLAAMASGSSGASGSTGSAAGGAAGGNRSLTGAGTFNPGLGMQGMMGAAAAGGAGRMMGMGGLMGAAYGGGGMGGFGAMGGAGYGFPGMGGPGAAGGYGNLMGTMGSGAMGSFAGMLGAYGGLGGGAGGGGGGNGSGGR